MFAKIFYEMAVTRLERKAARNKSRAKLRVQTIKRNKTRIYVTSAYKEESGIILEEDAYTVAQAVAAQAGAAPKAKAKAKAAAEPVAEEAPAEIVAAAEEMPMAEEAPVAEEVTVDPLNKVEGIGPKIAEVLQNAGIRTFADLAATTPEAIREILDAAEGNFAAHDPTTWPEQAAMAANGDWDALKVWQDEHVGGKPKA